MNRVNYIILVIAIGASYAYSYSALYRERREHRQTKELLVVAQQDAKDAAMQLNEARATIAALNGASKL
jgi:predicted RND superfamily exporter protein